MRGELRCCDFCGRDTYRKSVCKECLGVVHGDMETAASALMDCRTEWEGENDYDYSEDALGPKLAENRSGSVFCPLTDRFLPPT